MLKLINSKCIDGKMRMKPVRGYHCKHFKWHEVPFTWSECILIGEDKGCSHNNSPQYCDYFELNSKYKN